MPNLTRPPDKTADRPLPPPRITPYFRAVAALAAAERGLPPEPWAA